MKQKPLGHKSRIADSILRYAILHQEHKTAVALYNAWVNDVAIDDGFHINIPELATFALEQADACVKTPLNQLIVCAEIEDSMRR